MSALSATMLIIEDDPQMVRLFCDLFRHSDFNLICISSEELDLLPDMINEHQPAVVLMDYITISHHYDAVIHTVPLHIPTILLTPIEDSKFRVHVDYCIKKPFTPSQLYAVTDDIMQPIH